MFDTDPRKLQFFYGTAAQPCPYIEGRFECKAVTELAGPGAPHLHDMLSRAGFRRSHGIAYRPACRGCNACIPVRVVVDGFRPSRSMRRVMKRNKDLQASERPAVATLEQYDLFEAYEITRHGDGDMAMMDFTDYRAMVEDSPVDTRIIEYREPDGRLAAVALTDWLSDGLSGVYKFFAVDRARSSPGTYVILWHIEHARALGLPYVYLGYWIGESQKMAYKMRFQPLHALDGVQWAPFEPGLATVDDGESAAV